MKTLKKLLQESNKFKKQALKKLKKGYKQGTFNQELSKFYENF